MVAADAEGNGLSGRWTRLSSTGAMNAHDPRVPTAEEVINAWRMALLGVVRALSRRRAHRAVENRGRGFSPVTTVPHIAADRRHCFRLRGFAGGHSAHSHPPKQTMTLFLGQTRACSCEFCDLSNAQLAGRDLTDANLQGANLTGANLSTTNLSGANLPAQT